MAQNKKLYGMIALVFKLWENKQISISDETVMALIPIHEGIAILVDRAGGMNPDLSDVSLEGKLIAGIEDLNSGKDL